MWPSVAVAVFPSFAVLPVVVVVVVVVVAAAASAFVVLVLVLRGHVLVQLHLPPTAPSLRCRASLLWGMQYGPGIWKPRSSSSNEAARSAFASVQRIGTSFPLD